MRLSSETASNPSCPRIKTYERKQSTTGDLQTSLAQTNLLVLYDFLGLFSVDWKKLLSFLGNQIKIMATSSVLRVLAMEQNMLFLDFTEIDATF